MTSDAEIVARLYEGDFFSREIHREVWGWYTEGQKAAVLNRIVRGMERLHSLADATVISYTGPQQGNPREFVGWKVWLPGDPDLDGPWALARQHGQRMRVQDVPSGTSLMGRGAPRLFARFHGGLCVDAKSNTFLGPWRDAVQVHIAQMRENMKRRPKANRTETMALQVYLAQRTIGWVGQFQLAYAFLGLKHALAVCEADSNFRLFSWLRPGELEQLIARICAEEENPAHSAVSV
jgi:hypothetical protein